MIGHWLHRGRGAQLLLFCNGWGMDHHPLVLLEPGGYDVLVLSDYRGLELPLDLDRARAGYDRVHLVGWSLGVWAAQRLFAGRRHLFERRIAVNGTLKPVDAHHGIEPRFFAATLENYSAPVQERFYRRMCGAPEVLETFLRNRPRRSVAEQRHELEFLAAAVGAAGPEDQVEEPLFETAVIGSGDRIVPAASQRAYWRERCRVVEIEAPHFPFGQWPSWAALLDLADSDGS